MWLGCCLAYKRKPWWCGRHCVVWASPAAARSPHWWFSKCVWTLWMMFEASLTVSCRVHVSPLCDMDYKLYVQIPRCSGLQRTWGYLIRPCLWRSLCQLTKKAAFTTSETFHTVREVVLMITLHSFHLAWTRPVLYLRASIQLFWGNLRWSKIQLQDFWNGLHLPHFTNSSYSLHCMGRPVSILPTFSVPAEHVEAHSASSDHQAGVTDFKTAQTVSSSILSLLSSLQTGWMNSGPSKAVAAI